jgi:hypothetical protein
MGVNHLTNDMIIADGASSPSLLQLDVANAPYSLVQFIEFSVIKGFIRIFERKNTLKVSKKQIILFFLHNWFGMV